ncbi:MAG: GatB/YqeY domain-containing protein [Rubrimonas sp.]|uniref:GatB/YqeY domain-containing protein n=1 Tax=Rubrimonas sp. TaxID=2036015 RepID=UPI002FDC7F5F
MREKIMAALKEAMKQKDETRVSTLRLVTAALKDREIALRNDEDADATLTDAEIVAILSRMVKQRQDSIKAYEEGGRIELAAREMQEIAVIRDFLPRPLNPSEIDAAIASAVAETEAQSLRDMGKVMGALKARYPGRMDFAAIGPKVRAALG